MSSFPKIYGFNRSSEAGPDNFSPSIFLGGCNMRCPYCMNAKMVLEFDELDGKPIEEVKKYVVDNNCDWVNVSGGEVTIYPLDKLINLFNEIRSWGCKVAISTNGLLTDKLEALLPYIQYVTMDIKTNDKKYNDLLVPQLRKRMKGFSAVKDSLILLRRKKNVGDFDYEVRTTLYRDFVNMEEIEYIGSLLVEDEKWRLQPFRRAKNMIGKRAYDVEPYSEGELDEILIEAQKHSYNAVIDYV
jgi:pyruvate formate lyase activating enzyme